MHLSMDQWISFFLTLGGAIGGGYLGVKVTVAVLEAKVAQMQLEITSLRADRHKHANLIQDHEARIDTIERWLDKHDD